MKRTAAELNNMAVQAMEMNRPEVAVELLRVALHATAITACSLSSSYESVQSASAFTILKLLSDRKAFPHQLLRLVSSNFSIMNDYVRIQEHCFSHESSTSSRQKATGESSRSRGGYDEDRSYGFVHSRGVVIDVDEQAIQRNNQQQQEQRQQPSRCCSSFCWQCASVNAAVSCVAGLPYAPALASLSIGCCDPCGNCLNRLVDVAALLYNSALAYHMLAASSLYHASTSAIIDKSLRLYELSWNLVAQATTQSTTTTLPRENKQSRMLRLLSIVVPNNVAQIVYELGFYELSNYWFSLAFGNMQSIDAQDQRQILSGDDWAGLIFNTMVLSRIPPTAGAA